MPWGPQPSIQCDYITGVLGALDAELILNLFSASTATVQVAGTWSGTLTFEFSNNNFQTAHPAFFSSPTVGLINTTTSNGNFRVYGPAGYLAFRAKMTGYSSGSATVTLTSALGNSTQVVLATGLFQDAEVPTFSKPLLMGGVDTVDSSARSLKITPAGLAKVDGSGVTQPVSGTFFQATQPVSGPLTDAQLRATPVPISGILTLGLSGQTLKRAVVALASTGDIIPLVVAKKLKVYQYALQSRADGMTVQFRDGAAGSLLTARWGLDSREGVAGSSVQPPAFLLATTAGNALQAVISGTGTVDIEASYWDDDAL